MTGVPTREVGQRSSCSERDEGSGEEGRETHDGYRGGAGWIVTEGWGRNIYGGLSNR